MSTTTTYRVAGMTCAHCVQAVTVEVAKIPGVADVDVDLPTGVLAVASDQSLDHQAIREAVEEAGYELAAG